MGSPLGESVIAAARRLGLRVDLMACPVGQKPDAANIYFRDERMALYWHASSRPYVVYHAVHHSRRWKSGEWSLPPRARPSASAIITQLIDGHMIRQPETGRELFVELRASAFDVTHCWVSDRSADSALGWRSSKLDDVRGLSMARQWVKGELPDGVFLDWVWEEMKW